jgi:hypothetical protein
MSPLSWGGVSLNIYIACSAACLWVILKNPASVPSDDCVQPSFIFLDSLQEIKANVPPALQLAINGVLCIDFLHPQIFDQNVM